MLLRVALVLASVLAFAPASAHFPLEDLGRVSEGGFITTLAGVHEVAISRDGRFLYCAARDEDGIQVLERDPVTGRLSFEDVEVDGVDGVDGVAAPGKPALDPTSTHLYVPGEDDDSVAVFSRDAGTGFFLHMGFVEVQRDGIAGVTGLDAPRIAVVSPDGAHVYAGAANGRIAIFARDAATGALDFLATLVEANTSGAFQALAFAPDGKQLYAGTPNGELFIYPRTLATGALGAGTEISNGVGGTTGLGNVLEIAVTRDGADLYAANASGNALLFARNATTGSLAFVAIASPVCDAIAIAADGRRAYCGFAIPSPSPLYAVRAMDRNASTGALTERGGVTFSEFDGVDSALHGGHVLSPDGAHLYAAWSGESAVAVASITPLEPIEEQTDGAAGVDGIDGAAAVALSPDGGSVYAAGYDDDAIAVFSRDAATGVVAFVERKKNGEAPVVGLNTASAVAVSPDGKHVYATGDLDASLVAFSRNATTGALTFVEREQNGAGTVVGLNRPVALVLAPDGAYLYAASTTGSVAVFSRNPASGALDFVEAEFDGSSGVDGLAGASALALSPDGAHLYVAGTNDDEVAIFERNAASGLLGFVATLNAGAAPGLADPRALALSPNGDHLYASVGAEFVFSFARDSGTGLLLFLGAVTPNDPLYQPRLDDPEGIAVSTDGSVVVVTGSSSDTLAVFRRNRTTGTLGFAQVEFDGVPLALDGAGAVAAAPNRGGFYVASQVSNALAVYAPEPGDAVVASAALAALAALSRLRARQ